MFVMAFRFFLPSFTGTSRRSGAPLQYQNKFRLQEARTILRYEKLDVGDVSRRVGYESSSRFSREDSRLFGKAPVREISKPRSAN